MKLTACLLTLCSLLAIAETTHAASAVYTPHTGSIEIFNDMPDIDVLALYSQEAAPLYVTDESAYLIVPGTIMDLADIPLGVAYLGNFPQGHVYLGNIVVPGTPVSQLKMTAYAPFTQPGIEIPVYVWIPEPSTMSMGITAAVASLFGVRRKTEYR